ncbi:beta-L-arabinofuranosidase domain-containing protein [Cellulomonas sp.]|uniref:glycoside hydrolase family 127 protein n=1 Tax=Cellulomonas sp. TaxID=40001 RepID=UPI00258C6AFF|nr:beta-L-arabinofuranosidase domain-containing protein [Cellulomonas sp.]MCR6689182.1 glycoside hydrolase family 127 protein [Cellulomonas sp.]
MVETLSPGPCVPRDGGVRLRPLPFDAVRFAPEDFFGRWQELNRTAVIPHLWENLESSGVLTNLRIAAGQADGPYRGFNFADSDLHKTLEAVAWEAGRVPHDQPWEADVRAAVALLAAAQREDGYLDSHVQVERPDDAFADLRWGHELYVLGHLLQAAVARVRTGGGTDLLAVARRFAELVDERFDEDQPGCCGHPEVETALVELARLTGEARWLDLARRQVAARGHGTLGEGPFPAAYHQDHVPVADAHQVAGHAVRQVYLAAGVADVVTETGDTDLRAALLRLWDDAESTRTYVTGGIGSRHKDEAFGDPYELSPERAYAETCAAIGVVHWAWRMLLLTGEGRFADAMERALYNAVPAGLGRDGRSFFYSNPLQLRTDHDGSSEYAPGRRLPWFACACCPPNLARLASSLHAYAATRSDDGLALHLYGACEVVVPATTDRPAARLVVRTDYPWDGAVDVEVPDGLVEPLALRVPGWADVATVTLAVDGAAVPVDVRDGYVWVDAHAGATVHHVRLDLPMPVVPLAAHPRVDAVRGCVALRRGPVVLCLEQADLPDGVLVEDVRLVAGSPLVAGPGQAQQVPVAVRAHGVHVPADDAPALAAAPWTPDGPTPGAGGTPVELTFVPYHAWGERTPGAMRVWVPVASVTR